MKKIYYIFIVLAVCLFNYGGALAQTVVNVVKNDSLIIELDGYKQGDIVWQRSANKSTWLGISAAKGKEEYRTKASTPFYYRSIISDGTCEPVYSDTIQANLTESLIVKGGQGYVESAPFVSSDGIRMTEQGSLSNWADTTKSAVWFLYQKGGTYEVSFYMRGTRNFNYQFEMNVSTNYEGIDYDPETFSFSHSATGLNETVPFFTVTVPQDGYYRYELSAKSFMTGLTINELRFNAIQAPGQSALSTYAASRLFSTSLHLGFHTTAPTTGEYDWIYEEILVPEGYDPTVTFWMSLGYFAGYMGIQANSDTERRVLFSAWDALDKDKNPTLPKDVLVTLVDKGENVFANSFGAEGTGGQSYIGVNNPQTWKTGTPVKFLMNARRVGEFDYDGITLYHSDGRVAIQAGGKIKHTLVSAWYDANDGEGWKYVATWRTKKFVGEKDMFDGFYSFVENFWQTNGQIPRKGYYYNAFGKELTTGNWTHFNRVNFSNDGNARTDHNQGVDDIHPDKFYMLSGGYGKGVNSASQLPLLDAANVPNIQNLDLDAFSIRVNQALVREEYLGNLTFLNKTDWRVVDFSSQETSGEGATNGRAATIIDGNENTYWHSAYNSGSSSFPHWFVIDMAEAQNIKGFRFTPSGGLNRYPKDITIEVANSATGPWTKIWEGTAPITPEVAELSTPETGYRYFKLSILDGYSDGHYTRLGEIDVY